MYKSISTNKPLQILLVFGCLIIGLFHFPLSLVQLNLSYIPGDLGDARFINFVLEHGYQYLIGNEPSFYNAPFFYPAKNTLALSDNMAGTLPIYAFFRSLNYSRETAYQLWWVSIFVINYFVAFFCFKNISKNNYIAILGAYLFTFSMIMFGQVNFTQLNIRFMLPLIILFAYRFITELNIKFYYFLVISIALQFVLGVYYAFLSIYLLLIIYLTYLLFYKNIAAIKILFSNKKQTIKTIGFTLSVIACLLVYMQNYIAISSQVGLHRFSDVINLIPTFTSYFLANDGSIWAFTNNYGKHLLPDSWWLNQFFMGLFPLLLLIVNFIYNYKNKHSTFNFLLISIVIAILGSVLYANKYSILALFYLLPGFGSLSVLVRVITVIFTLIVFVNIQFLTKVFNKYKKWNLLLFISLFTFLVLDNWVDTNKLSKTKKETILNRYKNIEAQINKHNDKKTIAIVSETPDSRNFKFHMDAFLFAQTHGLKSINGYSSNAPKNFGYFWENHNRKTLNDWCIYNNIDTNKIIIIDNKNPITNTFYE